MKKEQQIQNPFKQASDVIEQQVKASITKKESGAFIELGGIARQLIENCRESLQQMMEPQVRVLIKKLKSRENPNADDIRLIRYLMVDDAESYLQAENNFTDWISEVQRLSAEISKFSGKTPDVSSVSKLRGLLMDLDRTTSGIARYLEDKERVSRFENATQSIDDDERKILIENLERKLNSKTE